MILEYYIMHPSNDFQMSFIAVESQRGSTSVILHGDSEFDKRL